LLDAVAEWKANTFDEVSEFSKPYSRNNVRGVSGSTGRKQGECFLCGKPGHFAKDCRNTGRSNTNPSGNNENTGKEKVDSRTYKCYGCGEIGHKKPDCSHTSKTTKKVVRASSSKTLRGNELMAQVGDFFYPLLWTQGPRCPCCRKSPIV